MRYDAKHGMSSLVEDWVALANARQRRGRAGRVREGDCYYAYSRARARSMESHTLPEMLRVPLEQVVLQVQWRAETRAITPIFPDAEPSP